MQKSNGWGGYVLDQVGNPIQRCVNDSRAPCLKLTCGEKPISIGA